MKLYVEEIISRTSDGERIITIKTYESRPKFFNYIIYL